MRVLRSGFLVLMASMALSASMSAFADAYPSRPLTLMLGYPPGGVVDALGRSIAIRLSKALGQSVIVQNRPGAQTVIAADLVAKAPADGYTVYLMSATHVLSPYLIKTLPFNPLDDFTPIAMLGTQGYVIIAGGGQPFRSLHDLTDYAHLHPDSLSVGTTDMTTLAAAESVRERIGVKMTTIPYKGGGPLVTDVIGGQVSIGIVSPSAYVPMAKDSRLNGLGVTAPARFAALPAVPTVAEASGKPGVDVQNWFILAGPAKMPSELVQRLHAEIVKILADPDMRKQLADNAIAPAPDLGTPAMLAMMKDYQQQVGKLLVAAGVTPE